MSIKVKIIFLGLILALAGNCKEEKKVDVIATVGDDKITYDDYLLYVRQNLGFLETDSERVAKAIELVNVAIDERILVQEGYRTGLDKDQEIQLLVDGQKTRFLLDELYKVKVIEKAKPSTSEIKAYYNKSKEQLHPRHILVKEKKEADEIYSLLKKGANFDTLAKEKSIDPSAQENGGDLSWVSWGMMVDPFQEAAWKLKAGQISGPVKTQYGWHIIKLEERKAVENPVPFDQLRESIGKRLDSVKRRQLVDSFLDNLKQKAKLKINPAALELVKSRDQQVMSQDTSQAVKQLGAYLDSNLFGIDEKNSTFATYKGGQMTVGDFLQRYTVIGVGRKPALNDEEGLKQFVFQTLMSELLEKESLRLRLDKKKSFVENIKKLREKMMADKLRNDLLLAQINVTQEEIRAYYENHKGQFMHPVGVRVQEIMLPSEAEAKAVLKQLKAGASFSKLARQKTMRAGAKEKGGDLGYFSQTQYPGLFNACQNLKVGELAGPVLQGGSFCVIKFLGRKEPSQKTYEEAQKEAETKALTEKKQLTYNNWIASRKALIKVEVNTELLSQKLEQEFAKLDQTPKKKTLSGSFPFKVKVGPGGVIEQVK
ncbi:MAG: PpiC-type peptidyl-prolyl cis-trans isomerase [candidate division Zixibacteria bacterium RBG-1]|nr:MAG: PpiC-type peptidyl-prolyl cis-trans isomerase [candidate division Zixibacteria bacterium RBG-1]OGC86345.1 MAG: hypothetical protein A2V73_02465 [candidate division Zixibacteria bacterium RBG_19FT_COMBO_42_43]